MTDAATLDLPSLVAAVQQQITAHSNAASAAQKAEEAATQAREKRNAARDALYKLRDQANGNPAAKGAVAQMLRDAKISIPPSKR